MFRFLSCNYEIYISRVIFFVSFYNYIRTHATIYVSYGNTKARCVRSLNHLKPSDSICRIRQLVDRVVPYMRDGYYPNNASYHARRLLRVANPTRVKLCYLHAVTLHMHMQNPQNQGLWLACVSWLVSNTKMSSSYDSYKNFTIN